MNNTNYRPTWAEINLKAVRHNLSCIRSFLKENVGIMAIVKANAYGHGICEVSDVLAKEGVEYLGVATVDEALTLRNTGFKIPILVMGSVLETEAEIAAKHDITVTLCDRDALKQFIAASKKAGKQLKVHVKVDTGMGRIGVWHEEAVSFISEVSGRKEIDLEGVYTHFSSAGRDKIFTTMQIESFERILEEIEKKGINIKYKHAANSIAIVDWKKSHLNLVRPGILLYGIYPKRNFRKKFDLEPVMTLKTRVVHLKNTPPGRSISYGRTFITQSHTNIATIPIGYADGYGRILSNKAEALIKGHHVKIAGIVTMDQTLLDIGHLKDVKLGDEVILIGKQGEAEIPVEKVAKLAGTIPYEIVAGITDRVPRVYKN